MALFVVLHKIHSLLLNRLFRGVSYNKDNVSLTKWQPCFKSVFQYEHSTITRLCLPEMCFTFIKFTCYQFWYPDIAILQYAQLQAILIQHIEGRCRVDTYWLSKSFYNYVSYPDTIFNMFHHERAQIIITILSMPNLRCLYMNLKRSILLRFIIKKK